MKFKTQVVRLITVASLLVAMQPATSVAQAPKKKIVTETDLPRFTYPAVANSFDLVKANDATFRPFLDRFAQDLFSLLNDYDVEDKATLRTLLSDKEDVEILRGDLAGTTATFEQEGALIEKASARELFKLSHDPFLSAWRETGKMSGSAFQRAYGTAYGSSLQSLDWKVAQESLKSMRSGCGSDPRRAIEGFLKRQDEDARRNGTISFSEAAEMLHVRVALKIFEPLDKPACSTLISFVASHTFVKPDIWAARELDLTDAANLTPVKIAIWDSGVDSEVYAKQMYNDTEPGDHGPHGLAFDMHGMPFKADLQPLTPEQKAFYPKFLELRQGMGDRQAGIQSPANAAAQKFFKDTPPDKIAELSRINTFLGQYAHGTHVAGIAIHGNPAAQLVIIQFNDSIVNLPFAPTVEWAMQFKADFQQVGDYLREHHVRVVNMSWSDSVSEFEQWLSRTSAEKDPAVRKRTAEQIYTIWKEAVQGAIERAPDTLFFAAAGNSDSDAGFNGDVPASLQLPNLVTVGAVDQAGEETSFTSYGKTVVLHADGYRVLSYVPGGTQQMDSGTSMASPNAANLAAKLFAVDPTLTPAQVIKLIKDTADTSADGRLHLINPKAALDTLKGKSTL